MQFLYPMQFVLSACPGNGGRRREEADKRAVSARKPPPHVGGYGAPAVFRPALRARSTRLLGSILFSGALLIASVRAASAPANIFGWSTNGPAVYALVGALATNRYVNIQAPDPDKLVQVTNPVFSHFLPGSLDNLIWTNFMARTNGRDMTIWSTRSHPLDWPVHPPNAVWNTSSLIWGMKGATALSPCWEVEGAPGQVAVTALTRRHGYARGHGMGPDGFNTGFAGKKVWFVTPNDTVVQATVARNVVRTAGGGANRDYTILLFNHDLPPEIEPLRVLAVTNLVARYPVRGGAPHPLFKSEQSGKVSTEIPGFLVNTWKGGDSGSPDMLPLPNELVFLNGRSTSGPSPEMQADMDHLCELEHLDPKKYQLQWVDLSAYPAY